MVRTLVRRLSGRQRPWVVISMWPCAKQAAADRVDGAKMVRGIRATRLRLNQADEKKAPMRLIKGKKVRRGKRRKNFWGVQIID
jgi:hypothetical protein